MKIKRCAAICLCLIMVVSAIAIPVSASNHTDTDFRFFMFNATSDGTPMRAKTDDSYMYLKPTLLETAFTARAVGSTSTSGTRYWCDNGYIFRIDRNNREYFINNWVYEWGYSYGGIYAERLSTGIASGVWSPDSV